jgi:hypothetical protein
MSTAFAGIDIGYDDLVEARDRFGYPAVRELLREHGVKHLELEMLMGWYETGDER